MVRRFRKFKEDQRHNDPTPSHKPSTRVPKETKFLVASKRKLKDRPTNP